MSVLLAETGDRLALESGFTVLLEGAHEESAGVVGIWVPITPVGTEVWVSVAPTRSATWTSTSPAPAVWTNIETL